MRITGEEFAMTSDRIATGHCAVLCARNPDEIMVGVSPGPMHVSLLASYLLLHERGWEAIRNMIVADIRGTLDLGALKRAADLLIVSRMSLFDHPESKIPQPLSQALLG